MFVLFTWSAHWVKELSAASTQRCQNSLPRSNIPLLKCRWLEYMVMNQQIILVERVLEIYYRCFGICEEN